jgi:hypothetical protein
MQPVETPWLDDESLEVLGVAYRMRPTTVAELRARLDPRRLDRLDGSLAALEAAALLARDGDQLVLRSPYASFIGISQARIEAMIADTERGIAMYRALPTLIRNWDLGEAVPDEPWPLAAVVAHGADRMWEVWRDHLVREDPRGPSWALPVISFMAPILTAPEGLAAIPEAALAGVRFLVRPTATRDPLFAALVAMAESHGGEVRMLDELPGWFYADRSSVAATPVTWGETSPTSLLFMRTPPVVAALALLFDSLWARGKPVRAAQRHWAPVLDLLAEGLTDAAIAHSLDIDIRTVRRRVADAMYEYGVGSRFALGAAWAESRR